jgi:IS5 family transposase
MSCIVWHTSSPGANASSGLTVVCRAERGRPGLPIRLFVGLQYLKHFYARPDEEVVARWMEIPYWEYFCGEAYFQHALPVDPSQMARFLPRIW